MNVHKHKSINSEPRYTQRFTPNQSTLSVTTQKPVHRRRQVTELLRQRRPMRLQKRWRKNLATSLQLSTRKLRRRKKKVWKTRKRLWNVCEKQKLSQLLLHPRNWITKFFLTLLKWDIFVFCCFQYSGVLINGLVLYSDHQHLSGSWMVC